MTEQTRRRFSPEYKEQSLLGCRDAWQCGCRARRHTNAVEGSSLRPRARPRRTRRRKPRPLNWCSFAGLSLGSLTQRFGQPEYNSDRPQVERC